MNSKRQIRIKKEDVLKALETNLDVHQKQYQEAKEGFKKTYWDALQQKEQDYLKNGKIDLSWNDLTIPKDNSKKYEDVICMLTMMVDEEIEISVDEFEQWVLDKWHWKRNFLFDNAKYSMSCTRALSLVDDD